MGEGIRSGIGILSAFKDTVEESIREARERGDLSADRAKELLREAVDKAQSAASGARERLDFANHGELEALQGAVEALTARVSALEARVFEVEQEQPAETASDEEPAKEGDQET
jgi:polyhydroxyalkanoate synthesis regulator phasin